MIRNHETLHILNGTRIECDQSPGFARDQNVAEAGSCDCGVTLDTQGGIYYFICQIEVHINFLRHKWSLLRQNGW